MHLGSLLAAVGSYLDARAHGARWLVRIEDLDTPRVIPGCADEMLRTLEAFGFEWDGEVLYQSTRREAYRDALAALAAAGRIFRLQLLAQGPGRGWHDESPGYPGTCRARSHQTGPHRATLSRQRYGVVEFDRPVPGTCRNST